jgi:cell division protein FtsW
MLKKLSLTNRQLLVMASTFLLFGLNMVFSSSGIAINNPFYYFLKQLVWMIISLACFMLFMSIDYTKLRKFSNVLLIVSVILLVLVLVFGKRINGAKRWLNFVLFSFQPSEFVKLALIIALADYLDKNKSKLQQLNKLLPCLAVVGAFCGLIAVQPDIGMPFVIVMVTFILLFISGAKFVHLMTIILLTVPIFVIAVLKTPFRAKRFFAFLDPWEHAQDAGYQLIQSLLSLGSGGLFGKGLGQSEFKRFYLPAQHTDFIFSIIGEELGVLGTIGIIAAFAYFLYIGYKISRDAPDLFGTLLGIGLTLAIVLQAYFNIAVCTGCVPTKGISLPFISYGGTSLVLVMIAVGILANISQKREKTIKIRY